MRGSLLRQLCVLLTCFHHFWCICVHVNVCVNFVKVLISYVVTCERRASIAHYEPFFWRGLWFHKVLLLLKVRGSGLS